MDDIKTFVLLKYEILTYEKSTWHLCNTYPPEVNSKWAWRCAGDVEHLAKGNKEAEECIRVAKLYRDGLATRKELDKAWLAAAAYSAAYYAAYYAAYSAYYAAYSAAYYAAYSAYSAAAAASATTTVTVKEEKWNLYISWLIEELCEYERNNYTTIFK